MKNTNLGRRGKSNEEIERIWREKYADPNYYRNIRTAMNPQSTLRGQTYQILKATRRNQSQ